MSWQQILDFWFGTFDAQGQVDAKRHQLWFGKDEHFDMQIKQQFEKQIQAAAQGQLADWLIEPQGRLAIILLLDQFTRNTYRGSAQAYHYDAMALAIAQDGIQLKQDHALWPIQRVFFYLPFEHAEIKSAQITSVSLFNQLVQQVPSHQQPLYANYLAYAQQHKVIIDQFGRFPHRNALLGRESTPAEHLYLQQEQVGF